MKLSQVPFGPYRLDGNQCLVKANAVIGATPTAFTTGNIIQYVVDGILLSLAAQTNTALAALVSADLPLTSQPYVQPSGLPGFYTQPINTTVFYVLGVNAAGVVKVVQGTFAGQAVQSNGYTVQGDGYVPDVPDGFIPFAILKVISGGAVFIPGTTALTGIGTFRDVGVIPSADRPF